MRQIGEFFFLFGTALNGIQMTINHVCPDHSPPTLPPQQSRGTTVASKLACPFCVTQPLPLLFVQSGCPLGMGTEVPSEVPAGSNGAFKGPEMKGKRTILDATAALFTHRRLLRFASLRWRLEREHRQ